MGISNADKKLTQLIWIAALWYSMIFLYMVANRTTEYVPTPRADLPQVHLMPVGFEASRQMKKPTSAPVMHKLESRILQRTHERDVRSQTPRPSRARTLSPTKAPILAPTSSPSLSLTKMTPQERQVYGQNQTTTISNAKRPLSVTTSSTPPNSPGKQFEYNGTNSFGACLFWMDDYERLVEWLAYHYHVLPMRHLVLFRDPKSTQDPTPILERWKPYLEITYWTSIDNLTYVPSKEILKGLQGQGLAYMYKQQGLFYRNCLNHLKRYKWKWTFVGDTDEMLVLNSKSLPLASEMMKEPGIILKTLQAAQSESKTLKLQSSNLTIRLVQNEKQKLRWSNKDAVCWCLTRQQFSGYESPKEAVTKDVPAVLDPYRFQTMRFRYHKRKGIIGKCIIDASRVTVYAHTRFSQHKLIRECGTQWGEGGDLMQVYHYLGTWDYFFRPNDVRGGEKRYKTFMKKNEDVNKTITVKFGDTPRNWLSSFVQAFGEEKALTLLEGVGFPFNNQTALPLLHVTD